jgi:hypothetical protein
MQPMRSLHSWHEWEGDSALPSVAYQKGHDRQYSERTDGDCSNWKILAGEVLAGRETVNRKNDCQFCNDHKAEGDESNAESNARQGRQAESVDYPPSRNHRNQNRAGDFQHLGKPLVDMQGDHLQPNDFQDNPRSNSDDKIQRAGLHDL